MLLKNSLFSITGSVVPVIVTIVTLPFMLALIGAERYGALSLAWLILIYSAQTLIGLGTAITHAVARSEDDAAGGRDTIVSGIATSIVLGIAAAILACAISWTLFGHFLQVSEPVRAELLNAVWLIGLGTFVQAVTRGCYGALFGKERVPSAAVAMMVSNAGLPLLALFAAMLISPRLETLLAATVLASALGLVLMAIDLWRSQLRGHRAKVRWDLSKGLLQFGSWVMVTAFVAPVLITMDRIVIGAQLGAVAVAAYTIPYQIVSRLQLVPQSVINVLFPRLSVAQGEKAQKMALYYAVLMSGFFVPIVIGLIFLIEPLLQFWLGDELDPRSIEVGTWMLCAFLLTAITQSMVMFLQSQEQGAFVAKFQLATIVPYFVLLFYCATTFGLVGVVAAFLVRRFIEAVVFVGRANFGAFVFWKTQIPAMLGVIAALLFVGLSDAFLVKLMIAALTALVTVLGAFFAAPAELRAMTIDQVRKRLRLDGHGSQD